MGAAVARLLLGADPELFVKQEGKFKSAHNLIRGHKYEPYSVRGGAVQVDGMALEFNIQPASNKNEFITFTNDVLRELRKMVPSEFEIVTEATAEFDPEYMEQQPENAKELGCNPDFNAYTELMNEPPDQHPTMRTAAGHLHFGWTSYKDFMADVLHFQECCQLVRHLDFFLGVPSILMDNNTKRREMYGGPGAFRPKPYGAEYRTLSNFWLKSKALMEWAYDNSYLAWERYCKGDRPFDKFGPLAKEIIDNNDTKQAEKLCKKLAIPFLKV